MNTQQSIRYRVGDRVRHRYIESEGDVTGLSRDPGLVYVNFGEDENREFQPVETRDLAFIGAARFSPQGWIIHNGHGEEMAVVPGAETAESARAAVASLFHERARISLGRWSESTKTFHWSAT